MRTLAFRTGRQRYVVAFAIVALCAPALPAALDAQPSSVAILSLSCTGQPVPNATVNVGGHIVQTDARGNGAVSLSPGTYQLSAVSTTPPAKLDHAYYAPSGLSGGTTVFANASGEAAFTNAQNGGVLQVFLCGAKLVHVRIGTTISCTDAVNEGFALQGGVTVTIGTRTYTSDARGYIEADVPAGTYQVGATYKDNTLGFVAQNGLRQRRDESGRFTLTMTDKAQTLEVRMLTCEPSGQSKARATITEIGNNIRVIRSRAHGKGFIGMQLRDGDLVTVYGAGKISWLDPKVTISFENPKGITTFRISPDDAPPAGNKPQPERTTFDVLKGVADFLMPVDENRDLPHDKDGNVIKWGASTNTIAVGIKGTRFSLGYDPTTQTSIVAVQEGVVTLTPRNASLRKFTLTAGHAVTVGKNKIGPTRTVASGSGSPPPPKGGAAPPLSGSSRATAPPLGPSSSVPASTASAHGCVGFNGVWQTPGGIIRARDGNATYGETSLQGSVSGNVWSGSWQHPTLGRGTFRFTLAPDGDSFTTIWYASNGTPGSYDTVRCIGSYR